MSLFVTLNQDLTLGPSLQRYAMACGYSRQQHPTPTILTQLATLYRRDGQKWLHPIHNLALTNITVVSTFYSNEIELYRAFLQPLFASKQQEALDNIANVLAGEFIKGQSACPLPILCKTTSEFMKLAKQNLMSGLADRFVRHEAVAFMMKYRCLDDCYVDLAACMVNRYCQLEKEQIYLLTLFEFNEYFEMMVAYMREMVGKCIMHPTNTALTFVKQASQSIYLYYQFNEALTIIVRLCVNSLMDYTAGITFNTMDGISEAINYETDLIGLKESETRYTIVAELIINLCKGVDGALAKILRTALAEIDFLLNKKPIQNSQLIIEMFPGHVDPARKVQISYLILCIISKTFNTRTDLLDELKNFFSLNGQQMLTIRESHPLINFRLIKLVECYCNILLPKQIQQALVMMLRCIRQQPNTIYSQQASQTFQSLITNKDLFSRIEGCIYNIKSLLGVIIEETDDLRFFDLLCFMIKSFKNIAEMYAEGFVIKLADKIMCVAKRCSLKMELGNQLIFKLFECLSEICKKKDFEDSYTSVEPYLEPITELLQDPRRINYQQQILDVAVILVKVSTELNSYVIGCLKYLKPLYQNNHSLADIYEFIYTCSNSAAKMILWEQQPVIRLFQDIVMDYLKKANDSNESGYVEGCYLMQVILQNFQPYYEDKETERIEVQKKALQIHPIKDQWRIPLDCVLISLFYIRPFEMPLLNCKITTDRRTNQLYMLYYGLTLKYSYTLEKFLAAMAYYQEYLKFKTPITSSKMQQQSENPKIYMDYRRIRLPITEEVDEVDLFKNVVLQLQKNNQIVDWQLPSEYQTLLKQLPDTILCGRSIRHIQRFNKIEVQESSKIN